MPPTEQADLGLEGAEPPQEDRDGAEEVGARQDDGMEAQQMPGVDEMAVPTRSPSQQSAGSMRSICKSNLKGASAHSNQIDLPTDRDLHAFPSSQDLGGGAAHQQSPLLSRG